MNNNYLYIPVIGLSISIVFFFTGKWILGLIGVAISFLVLTPWASSLRLKKKREENSINATISNVARPTVTANSSQINSTRYVSSYEKAEKLTKFKAELENRKRIFAESNRIIETTNNFDVFQRRMAELLDHIEWSYIMVKEGMPAQVNMSYESAIADYGRCYNENAVRIAKYIASTADTKQKAKNRIIKIEQIKDSLKEAANKQGSIFALDNILKNLQLMNR